MNNSANNDDDSENKFMIVGKKRNRKYNLGYKLYGGGNEKILLINGYLLPGQGWMSNLRYFLKNSEYQIVLFDHCGIGNSEWSFFTKLKELASDLSELLESLGWSKTNVIGLSMGSSIAYELGSNYPHLIKTLNLVGLSPPSPFNTTFNKGIHSIFFRKLYSSLYGIDKNDLFYNVIFSHTFLESPSKLVQGMINRDLIKPASTILSSSVYNAPIKTTLCHSIAVCTHRTKPFPKSKLIDGKRPFPIIIFQGTQDCFSNSKDLDKLIKIIKPNLVYICKDAGHMVCIENIDEFNQKSEEFFYFNQEEMNASDGICSQTKIINLDFLNNYKTDKSMVVDLKLSIFKLLANKIKKINRE